MINEFFTNNQTYIKSLLKEKNIYKVTPNSLHKVIGWNKKLDQPIIEAIFYSTNRIAENLFLYELPIKHPFGNKLLYFNSLTFNPATGEQTGKKNDQLTWTAARDAASSDVNTSTLEVGTLVSGGHYYIYRLFQPFLTSSLGTGAVVSASNWQGYRDDSLEFGGNGFNNASSTKAVIVPSSEADPTSYAASDYGGLTYTDKGNLAFSSIGANLSYSTITITDQTLISVSGYTKFAIITELDRSNTDPGSSPDKTNSYNVQNRASAHPPILTVTYTPAPGGLLLSDI